MLVSNGSGNGVDNFIVQLKEAFKRYQILLLPLNKFIEKGDFSLYSNTVTEIYLKLSRINPKDFR